jgi:hypothetical protein
LVRAVALHRRILRHGHRRKGILNILPAVAIGFLLIDSKELFHRSFQLSFLASGLSALLLFRFRSGHRGRWLMQ